jgi:hypothetical protein
VPVKAPPKPKVVKEKLILKEMTEEEKKKAQEMADLQHTVDLFGN